MVNFQRILYLSSVLFFFLGCADKFKENKEIKTTCPTGVEPIQKVLFIGWDGVRTDALLQATTPHLDSLLDESIYCWNVDRGPYTVSTPGWSTLLHGVWPNKHGLTENSFKKNRYKKYPDIFTILHDYKPNLGLATLSNWDAFLQITANETYAQRFDTDPLMLVDALALLDNCTPDAMLLHFDFPDDTGHEFGFSPSVLEYQNAIEVCDHYLGQLMNKIYWREANFGEKWLVVLTTDHGGEGTGHGNQDDLPQTRNVWYVVRSPEFTTTQKTAGLSVDILPSMLKWLNCPYTQYDLDGTALF
jgi:predicted AlkP superfamily pyrophosphatase or phosphodiesterase